MSKRLPCQLPTPELQRLVRKEQQKPNEEIVQKISKKVKLSDAILYSQELDSQQTPKPIQEQKQNMEHKFLHIQPTNNLLQQKSSEKFQQYNTFNQQQRIEEQKSFQLISTLTFKHPQQKCMFEKALISCEVIKFIRNSSEGTINLRKCSFRELILKQIRQYKDVQPKAILQIEKMFTTGISIDQQLFCSQQRIKKSSNKQRENCYTFYPTSFVTGQIFKRIYQALRFSYGPCIILKGNEGIGKTYAILMMTCLTKHIVEYILQYRNKQKIQILHSTLDSKFIPIPLYFNFQSRQDEFDRMKKSIRKQLQSITGRSASTTNQMVQQLKRLKYKSIQTVLICDGFEKIATIYQNKLDLTPALDYAKNLQQSLKVTSNYEKYIFTINNSTDSRGLPPTEEIRKTYNISRSIIQFLKEFRRQFSLIVCISQLHINKTAVKQIDFNNDKGYQVLQPTIQYMKISHKIAVQMQLIDMFIFEIGRQNVRGIDQDFHISQGRKYIILRQRIRKILLHQLKTSSNKFTTFLLIVQSLKLHQIQSQIQKTNPDNLCNFILKSFRYNFQVVVIQKLFDEVQSFFFKIKDSQNLKYLILNLYYQSKDAIKNQNSIKDSCKISTNILDLRQLNQIENTNFTTFHNLFTINRQPQVYLTCHLPVKLICQIFQKYAEKMQKDVFTSPSFDRFLRNLPLGGRGQILQDAIIKILASQTQPIVEIKSSEKELQQFVVSNKIFGFVPIKKDRAKTNKQKSMRTISRRYFFLKPFEYYLPKIIKQSNRQLRKFNKNLIYFFMPIKNIKQKIDKPELKQTTNIYLMQNHDKYSKCIDFCFLNVKEEDKQIIINSYDLTVSTRRIQYILKLKRFIASFVQFKDIPRFQTQNKSYTIKLNFFVLQIHHSKFNLKKFAQRLNKRYTNLQFKNHPTEHNIVQVNYKNSQATKHPLLNQFGVIKLNNHFKIHDKANPVEAQIIKKILDRKNNA